MKRYTLQQRVQRAQRNGAEYITVRVVDVAQLLDTQQTAESAVLETIQEYEPIIRERARAEARFQSAYELLELVIHEADPIDSTRDAEGMPVTGVYQWTFSAATLRAIEALLNEGGEEG